MSDNDFKPQGAVGHRRASRAILLAIALTVLLLAVCVIVAIMLLFFPVTDIELEGNSRYSYSELIEMSGVEKGDRLYYVDKDGIRARLLSAFPYLCDVRVHTYFPNRVKLEIEEHEEIYLVRHKEGFAYLSPELRILEITDTAPSPDALYATFISIATEVMGAVGEVCVDKELTTALVLMEQIKKNGAFGRINVINVEDAFHISFVADKRYKLILGSAAEVKEKLDSAERVCLSDSFKREECSVIDVTDRKKVTVRYIGADDIRKEFDFSRK